MTDNSVIDVLIRKIMSGDQNNQTQGILNDSAILANVKTFFVAGSETTSMTICWCLYFLWLHSDILNEVRSEISQLYSNTYSRVNKTCDDVWIALSSEYMPLTNAVFKETLRLCPPGAMQITQLESDTESFTMNNGLVFQPQDKLIIHTDMVMQDCEVFPDPLVFNPKRWLIDDKIQLAHMDECFMAFGSGPRQCPGTNLAHIEGLVGMCAVVQHFDFELACPMDEIKRILSFTAQPNKMPMCLQKRN